MYEIANIDKFGRIVLPKKMRSILGLGKSSTVFIEDKDHELVVKPVHKKQAILQRRLLRWGCRWEIGSPWRQKTPQSPARQNTFLPFTDASLRTSLQSALASDGT